MTIASTRLIVEELKSSDETNVAAKSPELEFETHGDPPGVLRNAGELFRVRVRTLVDASIASIERILDGYECVQMLEQISSPYVRIDGRVAVERAPYEP